MSAAPFTFSRCLRLCLPALVVGLVLRVIVLTAIPSTYFGPDSNSYFETPRKLWTENTFGVGEKRRWLYPILLAPLPALPVSTARSVVVIQHVIGLATVLGIGWIVGHLVSWKTLWVPVVTTLCAVWPRMLWQEQEMVAETCFLGAFVLTVALAFPYGCLRDRRRLFWFLMSAALIVALKPHGRGIWVGCLVAAALCTRCSLRSWDWKCGAAVALAIGLIITSGSTRQGNWLLLNSTLPLVDLDSPKYKEYRDALRPIVLDARSQLDQYPWRQNNYKRAIHSTNPADIDLVWASLVADKKMFPRVCADFARKAVLAHPIEFTKLAIGKIGVAAANRQGIDCLDPATFWHDQRETIADRWKGERVSEMQLYYRLDEAGYDRMSEEYAKRVNPAMPFLTWIARNFTWLQEIPLADGRQGLRVQWLGWLTALGFITCLTPRRFAATLIIWLPMFLYLGTVFAVGDSVSRYLHPVDWINLLLPAMAMDSVLAALYLLFTRSRSGLKETPLPA